MAIENKNTTTTKHKKGVKIMAWILSILMAGSCATLLITILVHLLTQS